MTGHYKERLESHIFEVVSDLLAKEARDPRLEGIVVTGVELNEDHSVARIFTMGGDEEGQRALRHAAAFLRAEVGRFLKMKNSPVLRFFADESLDRYNRIQSLLDSDPPPAEGGEGEDEL